MGLFLVNRSKWEKVPIWALDPFFEHMPIKEDLFKWSKTLIKRSKTPRNAQERSGTVNGQEWWMARNGERSETIILFKITVRNVYKITVTVRSRSRSKNEINTVTNFLLGLYFFLTSTINFPKNPLRGLTQLGTGSTKINIFLFLLFDSCTA